MTFLLSVFYFIFGTIIGSFLNVVILRYNTGFALTGRSGCLTCGKKLEWYELIPIFSFLFLKGKCSQCKSPISWQYPIVEFLTGALFLFTINAFLTTGSMSNLLEVTYYLFVIALLVIITVYDIRHTVIPDGIVYTFIAVSLIKLFVTYPINELFTYPHILDLFAGPILFLPFFILWFVSKGRWMGFGDAKLALGMGLFLGLKEGISAVIIGFWIGAVVSVIYMVLERISSSTVFEKIGLFLGGKHLTIKSEIPFAPYLILGTLIALFFTVDVFNLNLFFDL